MKASSSPSLALADLESILCEVTEMLGLIPSTVGVGELDGRVVQCRSAIAACQREQFSPPLLRALSAKVLEVQTDALVLRRTVRLPERALSSPDARGPAMRSRKQRRRRDG